MVAPVVGEGSGVSSGSDSSIKDADSGIIDSLVNGVSHLSSGIVTDFLANLSFLPFTPFCLRQVKLTFLLSLLHFCSLEVFIVQVFFITSLSLAFGSQVMDPPGVGEGLGSLQVSR